jgi:putative FmdB family regulatory protein
MPTYEFRCPQGHEFEKFYRSIGGAEARATCPVCEQPAERIMSAAGFAFKGSGFYLTDYGKNAHRGTEPVSGAPAGEGGSAESKGDAKSDTKGETKSESKGEAKGGADSSGASSATGGTSSTAASGDTKPATPKPAESKPASPPKKSKDE